MCISTGGEVLFARGGLPRRSLSCTFPVQGRLRYLVGRNPPHPSLLPCTFLLISHPACLCTHQSVQHASPHPRLYTALYCTPTTLVQRSYSYYALTRMHQSHASPACITRMHRLNASPVFRSHPQPHTAHARFPLAPIHTFGPTTLSSPTNHPQNHHPHAPPARRRISLHQPPRPHRRTGGHTPTPIRNTTTLSPQRFATHRCLDGCSLPWFHSVTPPLPPPLFRWLGKPGCHSATSWITIDAAWVGTTLQKYAVDFSRRNNVPVLCNQAIRQSVLCNQAWVKAYQPLMTLSATVSVVRVLVLFLESYTVLTHPIVTDEIHPCMTALISANKWLFNNE